MIATYYFIGWWKSAGNRSVGCIVLVLRNQQCSRSYWYTLGTALVLGKTGIALHSSEQVIMPVILFFIKSTSQQFCRSDISVLSIVKVLRRFRITSFHPSVAWRVFPPGRRSCSKTGRAFLHDFRDVFPPRSALGSTHHPSQRVPSENDGGVHHSSPPITEIKNKWSLYLYSPYMPSWCVQWQLLADFGSKESVRYFKKFSYKIQY
jgi:hypothetical protein